MLEKLEIEQFLHALFVFSPINSNAKMTLTDDMAFKVAGNQRDYHQLTYSHFSWGGWSKQSTSTK